jgi:hypothetical protein
MANRHSVRFLSWCVIARFLRFFGQHRDAMSVHRELNALNGKLPWYGVLPECYMGRI